MLNIKNKALLKVLLKAKTATRCTLRILTDDKKNY